MNAITTAVSGLNAAVAQLNVSASNIAGASDSGLDGSSTDAVSAGTTASAPPITPAPAQLSTGIGGDLGSALVSQMDALTQFKANLSVLKTSDEMTKSLLDLKA